MKNYQFNAIIVGESITSLDPEHGLSGIYDSSASLIAHQKKVTAIAGYVIDANGNPIEGALARLYNNDDIDLTFTTDADGLFFFFDIPSGEYTLEVTYELLEHTQTVTALLKELTLITVILEDDN